MVLRNRYMRMNCCASCVNHGYNRKIVLRQNPRPACVCCCQQGLTDTPAVGADWNITFDEVVMENY